MAPTLAIAALWGRKLELAVVSRMGLRGLQANCVLPRRFQLTVETLALSPGRLHCVNICVPGIPERELRHRYQCQRGGSCTPEEVVLWGQLFPKGDILIYSSLPLPRQPPPQTGAPPSDLELMLAWPAGSNRSSEDHGQQPAAC